MKRLFVLVALLLTIFLVSCDTTTCAGSDCPPLNDSCEEIETSITLQDTEYQRYRTKIVEIAYGDDPYEIAYIVEKDGYAISGLYVMETEQEYEVGDIVYVIVIDEYTCMPFAEWLEDNE